MPTSDAVALVQAGLGLIGTIALVWTLFVLLRDNRMQRAALTHQSETWQFEIYQRLDNRVTDLLWAQTADPKLADVFVPLPPEERARLDVRQAQEKWGAWKGLDADGRAMYRFTRVILESLEQMYEVRRRGWVPDDLWPKWQGWIDEWAATRYFQYVVEDLRPLLIPRFASILDEARARDVAG